MSLEEDLNEGKMAEAKERLNKTMSKGLKLADEILTKEMDDKRNVGLMKAAEVAEEARDAVRNVKEIRPDVLWFAQLMEDRLRANDYKPGWKNRTPAFLINKLLGKVGELNNEILIGSGDPFKEAANVANYAMMVADVTRPLFSYEHPPERGTACEWGPSPFTEYDRVKNLEERVKELSEALTEIFLSSPSGSNAERVAGMVLYGETWSNEKSSPTGGVSIEHTFTCSICGHQVKDGWAWAEGEDVPIPLPPSGWSWVKGLLVCSRHKVTTEVDGKKV